MTDTAGHYAQIVRPPLAPYPQLHRAFDHTKDQSYYLSSLTTSQLERAICPLGHLSKQTTRQLADYWGLPNKSREESMGICFVGERGRFGDFVGQSRSFSSIPCPRSVHPARTVSVCLLWQTVGAA